MDPSGSFSKIDRPDLWVRARIVGSPISCCLFDQIHPEDIKQGASTKKDGEVDVFFGKSTVSGCKKVLSRTRKLLQNKDSSDVRFGEGKHML